MAPAARSPAIALPASVREWLRSRRSPLTQRAYADAALRRVPEVVEVVARGLARRIGPEEAAAVAADLRRRGYRPRSVALTLSAFSSLWRYLMAAGEVERNPWPAAEPTPRRDVAERVLSEVEVRRLLGAARPGPERTLLLLLYASGARVSEICVPPSTHRTSGQERHGLYWRDVRRLPDGRAVLTLYGKGAKTREVPVPAAVADALERLRGTRRDDEPCLWWRSQALTRRTAHRIVSGVAARAGLGRPVSPHWLRHAHAAHSMAHGAPPNVVQATLGHADLRTTTIYARIVGLERGGGEYLDPDLLSGADQAGDGGEDHDDGRRHQ
jgi:site-specific recombinase XerD